MITSRQISCKNQDGDEIIFREDLFYPFLLVDVDGVYDAKNEIRMMDNTTTDGGIYQSTVTKPRNIVLTLVDVSNYTKTLSTDAKLITMARIIGKKLEILDPLTENTTVLSEYAAHRAMVDKVFKRGELGRLTFTEDGVTKVIDYYVESVTSTGENPYRTHEISLICPDPFFYDPDDIEVVLSQIVSGFEFIHEFTEDGEEFGRNIGEYENIYNESANEDIGITIVISAEADITNPLVRHMESGEYIQIGDDNNPFVLEVGDRLTITTGTGNKHVYLTHDNVKSEINYLMAEGSSFIQLQRGNNHIGYEAEVGRDAMTLVITYRLQYARA